MSGDDINLFSRLESGESVWFGLDRNDGRFFPLAGLNLNLAALISTAPFAFIFSNALLFFAVAWGFWRLGTASGAPSGWILVAFIFCVLSVGFVKIMTQITFPETAQIPLMLLFLVFSRGFLEGKNYPAASKIHAAPNCPAPGASNIKTAASKNLATALLALICGNLCIYFKETSFILVGGFAFFYLALSFVAPRFAKIRPQSAPRSGESHARFAQGFAAGFGAKVGEKSPARFGGRFATGFARILSRPAPLSRAKIIFLLALMLSAALFLALYLALSSHSGGSYNEISTFSPLRTAVVLTLAVPIVGVVLPLVFAYRAWRIWAKNDEICPFFDALLCVAIAQLAAFLVLGMASFHYFVAANFLANLYLLFFAKAYFGLLKRPFVRGLIALVAAIWALNVLPQSLHYYTLNKIQMQNYGEALDFVAGYAKDSQDSRDSQSGGAKDSPDSPQNPAQDSPPDSPAPKLRVHFYGFQKGGYNEWAYGSYYAHLAAKSGGKIEAAEAEDAEIIVVGALGDGEMNEKILQNLKNSHEILFESARGGYFPQYSLMSLAAWALQRLGLKAPMKSSANMFRLPRQVVVLRRGD